MDQLISIESLLHRWQLDVQQQPGLPMNRRLYWLLRTHILNGNLPAGAKLPASRQLAQGLSIARNTVIYAFDLLQAEGFLDSQTGDGTYVANVNALALQTIVGEGKTPEIAFSRRGMQVLGQGQMAGRVHIDHQAFIPGIPSIDDFPLDKWLKTVSQVMREFHPDWMGYVRNGGVQALKIALCQHLQLTRALQCEPSQIIVTASTQQSLDLLIRCLSDSGDTAWIEDPGYNGARSAMLAAGLVPHPIPVDEEGLNWQKDTSHSVPKLIYITPSHQYPLGSVMSLARRQALLSYAATNGAMILEDDYDSEFRYDGPPLTALQGLDQQGVVIYMGTFSKVMFPGLQLGYLVVPKGLVQGVTKVQGRLYREGQYWLQAALARFFETGQFASHIRRMRTIYRQRQQLLRTCVTQALGETPVWLGGSAGLHLVLALPSSVDDEVVSQRLLAEGIIAPSLTSYSAGNARQKGLVLGYAGVNERAIPAAAAKVAAVVRPYLFSAASTAQY